MDYQTLIGLTALIATAATAVITLALDRINARRLTALHTQFSSELAEHFSNQKTIIGEYFKMLERMLHGKKIR